MNENTLNSDISDQTKMISRIKIRKKSCSKIKDKKLIICNNLKTAESKMSKKTQTKGSSTTKVGDTKNNKSSKICAKK